MKFLNGIISMLKNPMVKAEISKILSISPSKTRKQGSVGQTTLYGYTEGEIEVIENQATAQEPIVENEEAYKFNSSNVIYWIGLLVFSRDFSRGFCLYNESSIVILNSQTWN